jgi:hypothetical protein
VRLSCEDTWGGRVSTGTQYCHKGGTLLDMPLKFTYPGGPPFGDGGSQTVTLTSQLLWPAASFT